MTARSRRKGKRGEYLVRDLFRRFGFEARRGIQAAGEPDQVHSIPGVHVEVKNDERLSIWAMLAQSERDAKEGETPVVFFKRNGTRIYFAGPAEEYLRAKRAEGIVTELIELLDGFREQGGMFWTTTIHEEFGSLGAVLDEFTQLIKEDV